MSEHLNEPEDFSLTRQMSSMHIAWTQQCESMASVMKGKGAESAYDRMQADFVEHFEVEAYNFLSEYFGETEYTEEKGKPVIGAMIDFHFDPIGTIIDSRLQLDLDCFDITKLTEYKEDLTESIVERIKEKSEDDELEKFDPLEEICTALEMEVTGLAYRIHYELSDRDPPLLERLFDNGRDMGKIALAVAVGNIAYDLLKNYVIKQASSR